MGKQNSERSKNELLPAIIVAALFWAAYTIYIDDMISSDLRLISSVLSEKILKITNIAVQRNGTVLFGNGMRFEVIGACSGSTILKVMLGAGLFLSLSWRGLTWVQRTVAVLLSAILALLSNALRVSLLVVLSLHYGHPIGEGIQHDSIGIGTFILCFITFCIICKYLSTPSDSPKEQSSNTLKKSLQATALVIVLLLLYLPFLKDLVMSWLGNNWDNSNRSGFIFFLTPLALATYQTLRYKATSPTVKTRTHLKRHIAIALIAIALTLPLFSLVVDVKSISGIGIPLLISANIYLHSDIKNTLFTTPLLVISILGFPRIILKIENILPASFPLDAPTTRIALFLITLSIQLIIRKHFCKSKVIEQQQDKVALPSRQTPLVIFTLYTAILALTLSFLLPSIIPHNATKQVKFADREALALPFFLSGGWIGSNKAIPSSDVEYFGAENIIYREYTNLKEESSPRVELLITFSGGDRHKNHPPEFCQSGSGWTIASKTETATTGVNSRPITLLRLTKTESSTKAVTEKYMIYFFSAEGESEEINFSKMMLGDISSRISGSTPNWLVIRIFCKSKRAILDFAKNIPTPLQFTAN